MWKLELKCLEAFQISSDSDIYRLYRVGLSGTWHGNIGTDIVGMADITDINVWYYQYWYYKPSAGINTDMEILSHA